MAFNKLSIFIKFKEYSFLKKVAIIGALFFILYIVIVAYKNFNKSSGNIVEVARIDSVTEIVSQTGNVTTAGAIPIYSTTTGIVEEVYVSNGDLVSDNDSLFKIKSTTTKQEQDAARSTYLAAKAALDTAKSTQLSLQGIMFTKQNDFRLLTEDDRYNDENSHNQNLAEYSSVEKAWLASESKYKTQEIVISQTQSALNAAWQAYQATQDSTVKAHLDGEVQNLGVAVGDLVAVPTALTQSSMSPALVLMNETGEVVVKINVGETNILKVSQGQEASIEFDAIKGIKFKGKVERIDKIATPIQGVVSFSVYVSLIDQITQVRSGMTADVDIIVANKAKVLTIPSSAIKPYQGGKAVRVLGENGEIEFVPIEIGARGIGRTEILSGIEEGREVIVSLANDEVERSGGLF